MSYHNAWTPSAGQVTVADVRVRIFRASTTDGVAMSFAPLTHRTMALIEVESDTGLIGYGESWINFPPWAAAERVAALREGVAPLLVGEDAAQIGRLHERMVRCLEPLGRQAGAIGPVMQAISGADMALWDLRGKAMGLGVAHLLGGRIRDEVPAYASSLGPTNVRTMAERCLAQGFQWVKLKLGFEPSIDQENLRTARAVLGPETTIVVDANQAWTLPEALKASAMLDAAEVAWVEEPIRGNRIEDLEEFARRTGHRVATGENIYGLAEFLPYLSSQAIAVLQPDAGKTGGLTESARVCQAAASLGRVVTPHLYGGAVQFAATLQLAACFTAIDRIEYDIRSNPLRDGVMIAPPRLRNGAVQIADAPGISVELDFEALTNYEQFT